MDPPKRRGSMLCEKCNTRMEVHLTYHRCPVCGKVVKKEGPGYRERTAQRGEKQATFIERLRNSISSSSSTPASAQFLELEPSGSTAVERVFFWLLVVLAGVYVHLQLAIVDAEPLSGTGWGSPLLFRWAPLVLYLAAIAATFHMEAGFRRTMVHVCAVAALACLLVYIAAGAAFHDELVAVYPSMESVTLVGRRWRPLVTAPGGQVWLIANAAFLGFTAWHIFHEERRHGRM